MPLVMAVAACGPSADAAPNNNAPTQSSVSQPTNDSGANNGAALSALTTSVAAQPTTAAQQPVNAQGEPLVAKVNDAEITQGEFDRAVTRFQQQQLTAADPAALRATVLDSLIDEALIEQAAAQSN